MVNILHSATQNKMLTCPREVGTRIYLWFVEPGTIQSFEKLQNTVFFPSRFYGESRTENFLLIWL